MIYRYVSSKTILGRISRFLDSSDWKAMAQLYISDAIQRMGLTHSTVYTATKGNDLDQTDECLLEIKNHIAELPCDLEILSRVECLGTKLEYTADLSIHGMNGKDGYLWGKAANYHQNNLYTVNDGMIKTSFEEAKIKLFYKKFKTDEDNFIMIPDIIEFKDALVWQVLTDLLWEGYKPKNASLSAQESENRAEDKVYRARQRMKQLTKDEREALSNQMTSTNLNTTESKIFN